MRPPRLADRGCSGVTWAAHWQHDDRATVVTNAIDDRVADRDERRALTRMGTGARHVIATVGAWLGDRCGWQRPRAGSDWGVLTRIAANVSAFNLGVDSNHVFARPTFACFDPFA